MIVFSIKVVEKLFSYLISVQLEHTPAENTSFAQLFLRLSRACLGKVISLWYQIAPKEGVFRPSRTQGEGWLAGSLARLVRAAGARGHLESAWLRTRSCPRRSSLARVQSIDRGPTGPRSRTAS
eukprot:COSAG06_NODE_3132_length_5805_cov_85.931300_7_plen_124_part_00